MSQMIEHPDLSKFAIIRTDYVAMLGSHPAAMLLSVVEAWTNWLKERRKSILVRLSGNALSDAVGGLFTRKTFMKAGLLLEELGLIARVQKAGSDRTYQYLLQTNAVQNRLNLLVWWNTLKTYSQLIRFANTGNWFNFGKQWLETLLGANVLKGTLESIFESLSTEPCDPTLKDLSNEIKNTTETLPVAALKNEIQETRVTNDQIDSCCTQISVVSRDVQLNLQVKKTIASYWINFPAALQRLKKAVNEGWRCNLTGVLIKALKEGVPREEITPIVTDGWKEWVDKAIKRGLINGSSSEGSDLRIHFRDGRASPLWSEIKSLSWEELTL